MLAGRDREKKVAGPALSMVTDDGRIHLSLVTVLSAAEMEVLICLMGDNFLEQMILLGAYPCLP